jgi:phage terminase small subunit
MPAPKKLDWTPPDRLSDEEREVWDDVVERGRMHPTVVPEMLETYCSLVVRSRAAADKVAGEGLVVDGGEKRGAVVHPALTAERELAEQVRKWAPLFTRPAAVRRGRGTMQDATRASITAAQLDTKPEFEGICLAAMTYAWLIDEAQREGLEALQKATYNLIPSYVKACAELQITPASVPAQVVGKVRNGGKVGKFKQNAQQRRLKVVGAADTA